MSKVDWNFIKLFASFLSVGVIISLSFFLGLKMIDYHFPSKFDKLIHCKKDN